MKGENYKELNFGFQKISVRQTSWYKKIIGITGKSPWPLCCSKCGGMRWVSAMYEDKPGGGDYCFDCKELVKIDFMSRDQYNKWVGIPVTSEEFESMWDPTTGPKEGYL